MIYSKEKNILEDSQKSIKEKRKNSLQPMD